MIVPEHVTYEQIDDLVKAYIAWEAKCTEEFQAVKHGESSIEETKTGEAMIEETKLTIAIMDLMEWGAVCPGQKGGDVMGLLHQEILIKGFCMGWDAAQRKLSRKILGGLRWRWGKGGDKR